VWLDHTGHNVGRQYGSSTKAWRFDALGLLKAREDEVRSQLGDVSFTLSFDPPHGKARRRTPENWSDFAARTITLRDDEWCWIEDSTHSKRTKGGRKEVKPIVRKFHDALVEAIVKSGTIDRSTTETAWLEE
jgi:hypothetical protein